MMWIGIGIALAVAAIAWRKSDAPGGFYDAQVYGMTAVVHRRYAAISLAFAAFFACALGFHLTGAGLAALCAYAVIAILYGTSFLRGAESEES